MKPEYKDPSWALQVETFNRLKNHALLADYKERIFDEVPQSEPKPYIRVGGGYGEEWGARDTSGFTWINVIDVFCDNLEYAGKIQVKEIDNLVLRAMTDSVLGKLNLDVHGFRNVHQDILAVRTIEEIPDSSEPLIIQHGVVEFTHIIQVL